MNIREAIDLYNRGVIVRRDVFSEIVLNLDADNVNSIMIDVPHDLFGPLQHWIQSFNLAADDVFEGGHISPELLSKKDKLQQAIRILASWLDEYAQRQGELH